MERGLVFLRYSVIGLLRLIRYRFFLFAGIFPYLLGQVIAWNANKALNWHYSRWGFLGILLVLIGVELFNEYFDAKEGGDRIFLEEKPKVPDYFFILGILIFVLAFFIGLYLTFQIGWPILLFSSLGFLAAYFYVGPPIKWAYRGLGEFVIALSYGPFMVLGSYYLQAKRIDFVPFFVSLICGLSIFCLAILNEIPDYYQDRLIGKNNLIVRLGKQKAARLFSFAYLGVFLLLAAGILLKKIPILGAVIFLIFPWVIKCIKHVEKNYDNPKEFLDTININVILYLTVIFFLGLSYLKN
mgnify:CR=1 FL=1